VRPDSSQAATFHMASASTPWRRRMNGIALHGGFIPYGGTFLTFADYSRPAIRLAALMRIRVVHVMTHDSIGLGEDGPTHQPVEHLASLRGDTPICWCFRPGDAVETAEAWDCALRAQASPSVLCCRGKRSPPSVKAMAPIWSRGAPMSSLSRRVDADVALIATGSEVSIAIQGREGARKGQCPRRRCLGPVL